VGGGGGREVGGGEQGGVRGYARRVEGLLLTQRPCRKEVRRGDAKHVLDEIGEGKGGAFRESVIGTDPDEQRLGAEDRARDPVRFGNQPAGDGHVDVTGSQSGGGGA